MINLKINNTPVSVKEGSTIVEAARVAGIEIPTLCHLKGINEIGACRVCVCEVKGMRNLVASCVYPVSEGMEVFTNTPRVLNSRKTTLELLLSDHHKDCLSCERNTKCELQKLSYEYGCDSNRFCGEVHQHELDESTEYLVRDNTKCILCRRCTAVCNKVQNIGVIGANERGFATHIGSAFDMKLASTPCIGCGQCVSVCPTGALREKTEIERVQQAIANSEKHVVFGCAPSVRVGLGEEFGIKNANVEGKIVTALKLIGADKVFDVNYTADLTILEEANELLARIQNGGTLPMFTSCCPAWINYVEHNYPSIIPHLSTCKSPQQMFGAVIKHVYSQMAGIPSEQIYVVSVMPCTAKKGEKLRHNPNGQPDVDAVLTTRELAKLIRNNGIKFEELAETELDKPFGEYTGAGLIFGASGGVMEAALRTAVEKLTGKKASDVEFHAVRGTDGVKSASLTVNGKEVRVAVVNGIGNAKEICQQIEKGEKPYDFIEVMTCPGGCVNGGGQPRKGAKNINGTATATDRSDVLYRDDANMKGRLSHENKAVLDLYDKYLDAPNSHKAHEILHTTYTAKPKFDLKNE